MEVQNGYLRVDELEYWTLVEMMNNFRNEKRTKNTNNKISGERLEEWGSGI